MQFPVYAIGHNVEKYTGDYQATGEVRGHFYTKRGKLRYVVEIPPGFLMVYAPEVLRLPIVGNDEPDLFAPLDILRMDVPLTNSS